MPRPLISINHNGWRIAIYPHIRYLTRISDRLDWAWLRFHGKNPHKRPARMSGFALANRLERCEIQAEKAESNVAVGPDCSIGNQRRAC